MNDEKLKKQIGINIANLRKRQGLTQAGLAEQVNYSDKAVSKWERGESVPDVLTLAHLAKLFGVSVDDLLSDPNALPEEIGKVSQVMDRAVQKTLKRKANKNIILMLCALLVWFVAMFIFVILATFQVPYSYLPFFFAIPATAIVWLSLRSAWHDFRWNLALISVIMWGGLLSIVSAIWVFFQINFWMLYLLGIPGQLAICLWFRLRTGKEDEHDKS